MNERPAEVRSKSSRSQRALWALLLLFAAGNVLPVFRKTFSPPVMAASQIVPAMLFALVHGTRVYRLRGMLGFVLFSLAIGYALETVGVLTGFPFGHYYFTGGMGPKIFVVPVLIGPAYLGMGYVAWTVTRVILASGNVEERLAGIRVLMLPLAASFVMTAWDLSFDPALSTYGRYWIWLDGGAYFGVPVSNFLGWYLTNYLIYQSFALYLGARSFIAHRLAIPDASLAVLFYAVCAAGCVLRAASKASPAVITDPAETPWRLSDINSVCALSAIFMMGAFVTLASVKLRDRALGQRVGVHPQWGDRLVEADIASSDEDELEQVP